MHNFCRIEEVDATKRILSHMIELAVGCVFILNLIKKICAIGLIYLPKTFLIGCYKERIGGTIWRYTISHKKARSIW